MPKVIEKELREWVEFCDAYRDEIRQPLTEFEEKEKARIAAHELKLANINANCVPFYADSFDAIESLERVNLIALDDSCEDPGVGAGGWRDCAFGHAGGPRQSAAARRQRHAQQQQ